MKKQLIFSVAAILCLLPILTFAQSLSGFQTSENDAGLVQLTDNGVPVWSYQSRQFVHEWVSEADRRRVAGCYFHPFFGLDGEILTVNATTHDNHQHHHGLWTSFMTFIVHFPDGTQLQFDTWTDDTAVKKDFLAWIQRPTPSEDGKSCTMAVKNGCFLTEFGEDTEDRKLVMEETVRVVTHTVENHPLLGRSRAVDFEFTWTPVDGYGVTLAGDRPNGKNFCSLAVRFTAPKEKPLILGQDGEIPGDPLRCDTPWVSYSSQFANAEGALLPVSIAIFPAPKNPQDGSGMAIRHYGMLVAGWPGVEGITLKSGESRTLRYRVWIHSTTDFEKIRQAYEEFCR